MQWLVHVMEVVLFGLIGCLVYNLARAVRSEKNQGILEVRIAPRPQRRVSIKASSSLTEAIKQLQLFWSTQMIEMRVEGIKPEMLKHPALNASILDYLQGASNAVADHFECTQDQRLHLQSFLLTKGMKLIQRDHTTEWLERLDRLATYENTEIYNSGYLAAAQWVATKTPPKEKSLLRSIDAWGLVA